MDQINERELLVDQITSLKKERAALSIMLEQEQELVISLFEIGMYWYKKYMEVIEDE